MSRGFLIVAQNNSTTDYIACARVLAKSLKLTNPQYSITLLTDRTDYIGLEIFDTVVTFPYSDCSTSEWRLDNDWQAYFATPYDETIKIEADVIVTRSLDSWWELCKNHDLILSTGCRTWRGDIASSRYYRQTIDRNNLLDVYNGITYFKKSRTALEFFIQVRSGFKHWPELVNELGTDEPANTDTIYAHIASTDRFINRHITIPENFMQWVHMKQHINELTTENWTHELVWELVGTDFRINTVSQLYPVHYHVKELALELEPIYDRQLKI